MNQDCWAITRRPIRQGGLDRFWRIGFFVEATERDNDPVNREPHKCLRLRWFTIHDLPADQIPYPAAGLTAYLAGDPGITIRGWAQ